MNFDPPVEVGERFTFPNGDAWDVLAFEDDSYQVRKVGFDRGCWYQTHNMHNAFQRATRQKSRFDLAPLL